MPEELIEILTAVLPSVTAIGTVGGFIAKGISKLKSFKQQTDDTVTDMRATYDGTVKEMSDKVDKALEAFEAGKIDRQTLLDLQNSYNSLKQELAQTTAMLKQRRY